MSIGLRIQGRDGFLKMQIAGRQLDANVRGVVRDTAKEYRKKAADEIREPKTGRVYGARKGRRIYRVVREQVRVFGGGTAKVARLQRKSVATKLHTASSPGQAPANYTGTLLRSLRTKFPRREKGYGAKVFALRPTAWYRHMLEFGTKHAAPRPLFGPLQDRLEGELESRILRAIDRFERDF